MPESAGLPQVFFPEQAATVADGQGRRMVFLHTPQLDVEIKRVLGMRPEQFTYRWGYHPQHRIHVLLVFWPVQEGPGIEVGLAIPAGAGDPLLDFLADGADLYLTLMPVAPAAGDELTPAEIQDIRAGLTVYLPGIRFQRSGEAK